MVGQRPSLHVTACFNIKNREKTDMLNVSLASLGIYLREKHRTSYHTVPLTTILKPMEGAWSTVVATKFLQKMVLISCGFMLF